MIKLLVYITLSAVLTMTFSNFQACFKIVAVTAVVAAVAAEVVGEVEDGS